VCHYGVVLWLFWGVNFSWGGGLVSGEVADKLGTHEFVRVRTPGGGGGGAFYRLTAPMHNIGRSEHAHMRHVALASRATESIPYEH
jgi:hypothetical protein